MSSSTYDLDSDTLIQSANDDVFLVPHRDDSQNKNNGETSFRYAYNYPQNITLPKPPSNYGDKKDLDDEDEDDEDENKFPQDSYSFIALNGPRDQPLFFAFGLMPFIFQCTLLLLMIMSVMITDMRSADLDEALDNPGNPFRDGGPEFVSSIFPSNTGILARSTQIISILSFVIFADETLLDIARAIELFPPFWSKSKDNTDQHQSRLFFSCVLRFVQGILAVVAVFLLVFTESSVIDIVLNFTAVNFISYLDETAFVLARSGKFGRHLKREAKRIEEKDLPTSIHSKRLRVWYAAAVIFTAVVTFTMMFVIVVHQTRDDKWITRTFRVQFGPTSEFQEYSGCFHMDVGNRVHQRFTYISDDQNLNASKLGYCQDRRQWIFFIDKDGDNDPCSNQDNEIAHSRRASTYDVSTSFDEDWFSFFNTPMDMYFITAEDENSLREDCGAFVHDGTCDPDFNNFYYQYDGGDCCAATCTGPYCGKPKFFRENGTIIPTGREIDFPHCRDQDMVTLAIQMDSITEIDRGDRTWWANTVESLGWEDMWRPRLVIECDGYTVRATSRLESLRENLIQAKIDAGADNCTITTEHFNLVWSASYRIAITPRGTRIEEDQRNPIPTKIGTLTAATMLDMIDLSGNGFTGTIPSEIGLNTNLTTLLIDNNALVGTIPSELENLKYLAELSVANNDLTGTFPWKTFLLERQPVTKLNFDNNRMIGTLPTEIALLTSLTLLSLYNNDFHGFVPTELKALTNLKYLNLGSNSFFGEFPSEVIAALTNLEYINIENNSFDGTFPTEIKALTHLKILDMEGNTFNTSFINDLSAQKNLTHLDLGQNSYTSSFPKWPQNMKNLTYLDLGGNFLVGDFPAELSDILLKLTHLDLNGNNLEGTLPTAIGKLTDLEHLNLANIGLTGTIPTEIGKLRKLTNLDLDGNSFSGQIPSEIGLLEGLVNLDVGRNLLTGTIPTEIGLLTKLSSGLWMYYNMLEGTIPCQLESISNLRMLNLNFNFLTGMIPQGLTATFLHVASQRESHLVYSTTECETTT